MDQRWLDSLWPFVRAHLPTAPASVLEIGCGPHGGFVPRFRALGYTAEGVDPEAPDEAAYYRVEFEEYRLAEPVDAVVACTSLHHLAGLDLVLERVRGALRLGGSFVVVEWERECFDEGDRRMVLRPAGQQRGCGLAAPPPRPVAGQRAGMAGVRSLVGRRRGPTHR